MIRVRDLPDQIGTKGKRSVLLCVGECAGSFSAHKGDYWQLPNEHTFECCGEPMILAVPYSGFREVKPSLT